MNRNKLKTYAPQARRDFIQAVTDRAALFGLSAKKTEPMTEQGDVVLIAGKPFPKAVGEKRKKLAARIQKNGFGPTMEAVAFTWFNRLVALRYMELHEYLEHGYRVLSNPAGHSQPELLAHAEHVDLAGLDKQKVIALKLDGTKEEELYRHVLLAQCNALNKAMPFLFAKIDDETELLLPDNLLHSDSLIRKLVNEIDEEDWQQVEIIGWLYQFYISERKDEVIGKVVASEDIPAATQLFTPNWIVKYLVQNTLGRQWVATNPASPLVKKPVDENDKHYFMEYYIEPAEQTPEVQEQLKAITPTSLNPEELTLLDPACGSGHILVEAYDLFKAIYQERGYRAKDIPALILQKNLFGLEIDDRAAQLAAFALMMKARADDRRIFDSDAKPNVLSLQDSKGLDAADITFALNAPINKDDIPKEYLFEEIQDEKDGLFSKKMLGEKGHVSLADIAMLLSLFKNAKTFGSLIQIPPELAAQLPEIEKRLSDVLKHGDLTHASAHVLKPLLQQALLLADQYDAVVANPPYMGNRFLSASLKDFAASNYEQSKTDTFAMFIERAGSFAMPNGSVGMITMHAWMFLSSFNSLRENLLNSWMFNTLAHFGPRAFSEITGEVVQTAAFSARNTHVTAYSPVFCRLVDGDEELKRNTLIAGGNRYSDLTQERFFGIPGTPIAYWLPLEAIKLFESHPRVGDLARTAQGLITSDNERFVRQWHEVDIQTIGFKCCSREESKSGQFTWFPYNKGGEFRRWYGNCECVVNWRHDGSEIRNFLDHNGRTRSRPQNMHLYFQPSVSWTDITTTGLATRSYPEGFLFDATGPSAFAATTDDHYLLLSLTNSAFATKVAEVLNPTMHFQPGDFGNLPYPKRSDPQRVIELVKEAIAISKSDWDADETSWDFSTSPLVAASGVVGTVSQSCKAFLDRHTHLCERLKSVEEENNTLFVGDVGLSKQWADFQRSSEVTLTQRSGESVVRCLISYSIGCMMGRYSLDKPGVIYAHGGNQDFDSGQYTTFPADDDGILPMTEFGWFDDDVANRLESFLSTAWPAESLDQNLQFVAHSLGPKRGESPRETIRRYLAADFFKHHLSMYSKRPIYWLFSSGKQRGFQALVYLHRYNEGTLARMRTEHVIPLLGKMTARINHLSDDIAAATSSQYRKRLETEKASITKQLAEVQAFDERLRHYADLRIKLNLDEGVKVNYSKFDDLLVGL